MACVLCDGFFCFCFFSRFFLRFFLHSLKWVSICVIVYLNFIGAKKEQLLANVEKSRK